MTKTELTLPKAPRPTRRPQGRFSTLLGAFAHKTVKIALSSCGHWAFCEALHKRKTHESKQKLIVSPDRVSAFRKGIRYGLQLMIAKWLTHHLSWIATVATSVLACVYIFSKSVVLQKFRPCAPTAKNRVDSELTFELVRMWDHRLVFFPAEKSPEFRTNLQDDFVRLAFEQLFSRFAVSVVRGLQWDRCASTQGRVLRF